jgi:hypothetical protein
MSSSSDIDAWAAIGCGAGLVWFFQGFRVYRKYRILADTPEMPIHSIPMGLVEIHGKAKGDQLVPSPVTSTPCFFYKVDVERWVRGRRGGHWAHARTDANGVRFYLEDGSGKVLVDAHGAEYDLLRTARRDTSGGMGFSRVFGRAASPAATGALVSNSGLLAYAQSVVSGGGSSFSLDAGGFLSGLASGGLALGGGSSGRYRLTEYCILPDHWYDVTGTCTENPHPKDDRDRNMIVKGENEPTFLISWRSEKGIEGRLRSRALLHILGGAALSVACLALLLFRFGLL